MTGLPVFLRHFLRRRRLLTFWFLAGMALLYWSQGYSVAQLYSTQEAFDEAAAAMSANAAFLAMAGPARALNTIGGQVAWQATAFGAVIAGLVSMFVVGGHTRAEEESGREELLRAAPVDRKTTTTAALLTAMVVNAIAGLAISLALIGYRLPVPGSLIMGVGAMLCGWFFAGVALLAVQLTSSTRAAYGITGAVIGAAYLLRAIGDVTGNGLSWATPIGWYQAMWGFSGDRWWPGLLLLGGAAALVAAAYAVFDRRDFGAGVMATRAGAARAAPPLASPLGLAWRLQRGSVLGWLFGLLIAGLAFGSFGDDLGTLIGDSDLSGAFIPDPEAMVDSFYGVMGVLTALIAAGLTVSSALRPRGEEEGGRVEPLLATGMSRRGWLLGHLTVTVSATIAGLALAGVGMGVADALLTGDETALWRFPGILLAVSPAVLLLGALAVLLHGVAIRWAPLAWLAPVYCVVVLMFGEILRFPDWAMRLSPFQHFALVPAEPMAWTPFVVTLVLAAAGYAGGTYAFGRRDLNC